MFELKKPAPSSSSTTNDKKKPKIAATKASLAREKAITAQLQKDASKPRLGRKRTWDQSEAADSYKTTSETLNERPKWDLRGQMEDLSKMYDLQSKKLEDILEYKRDLEILKNDKESEEKTALQQAAALRTKIQEMERNHTITIENLHAQQRIELQRLEDDSINFTRKLTTIQIEVTDSDRKLQALADQREQYEKQNELLRKSIQETTYKFDNIDGEKKNYMKEIKSLDAALDKINKEIEKEEKLEQTIVSTTKNLEAKMAKSNGDLQRIESKIKGLESKKNSMKAK